MVTTDSEAPSRARAVRARHGQDLFGLVLACVLGVASLPLPFGRDQGLYYYVGREWMLRGAIPYRDVFDHKTPGIYVLHALSVYLFGEVQWGIRVVDFVAVLLTGLVIARLSSPAGEPVEPGARGRAWALVSVLFYGMLNYWDTAQSELHYALLGCSSVLCARHVRRIELAAGLAGCFAGLALIMKPPVVWLVLVGVAILLLRLKRAGSPRQFALGAAAYAVGALAPLLATYIYFARHDAIPALLDVVVGANGYYVSHEHDKRPLLNALDSSHEYLVMYAPISTLLVGGGLLAFAWVRRARDARWTSRFGFAFALMLAAYSAAAMQMKFYLLHWTVMVPALGVLACTLGSYLSEQLRARRFGEGFVRWAPLMLFLVVYLFSGHARGWVQQQGRTLRYLVGADDRQTFADHFAYPWMHFSYGDSEWVGNWLRDHTSPDEPVAVRGFEPEVYAVARRRHFGRFFWTEFLTQPARAYRRAEYLAEDRAALLANPPRYLVARLDTKDAYADSVPYAAALGYEVVATRGDFAIMQRRENQ